MVVGISMLGLFFSDLVRGEAFSFGPVQIISVSICVFLILVILRPTWLFPIGATLGRVLIWACWAVAGVSALLLAINLVGLTVSLRNSSMYTIPVRYGGKERLALHTPEQVYEQMFQRPDENRKAYLARLNDLIFEGTIHYWEDAGMVAYNLQVPIYENYILFFDHYGELYHFCDARRAIERGATVCTQSSIILLSILHEQGIDAKEYALGGHTVALVEVDPAADEWWFADADFGTIIPIDYRQVENDPALILPYYQDAGYADEPKLLGTIVGYYGPEGNYSQGGIVNFKYCDREALAYQLKWAIPILGLVQLPLLMWFRKTPMRP